MKDPHGRSPVDGVQRVVGCSETGWGHRVLRVGKEDFEDLEEPHEIVGRVAIIEYRIGLMIEYHSREAPCIVARAPSAC